MFQEGCLSDTDISVQADDSGGLECELRWLWKRGLLNWHETRQNLLRT
jgi:hypothetical protein